MKGPKLELDTGASRLPLCLRVFVYVVNGSMIEVKQAVQLAVQYCGQLFGNIGNHLELEEVALSEDEKHWFITIGYDVSGTIPRNEMMEGILKGIEPRGKERKYKVVDVDAETGKVHAVKIRQPLERIL